MGLDLDLALISAILSGGDDALKAAREAGIRPDLLMGEHGPAAYKLIDDHARLYGSVPSQQVVEAKTSVKLPDVTEPADFFAKEVWTRKLQLDMRNSLLATAKHLDDLKPYEALDKLEKLLRSIRKEHQVSYSRAENIPNLWPKVMEHYDRMKAGERGILTPWPTINEETYGFWPEDLVLFAAKTGTGKTWMTAILAHHAWVNGHKVLFGSTEISKLRIAMRFAAIHFKVSYRDLRLGRLDNFNEGRLRKEIDEAVGDILASERLKVIGGDFDFRVDTYEDAIRENEPDLSIMDGAYLLKTEGKNRTERAANAFDELKRICKRTSVPNIVTMQFNREVKSNTASTFKADRIALTDVSSWNADLAYALIQTDDMKRDRRMLMKALKMREGEGEAFEINWNIDCCDFSELPRVGGPVQSGGDADPFNATYGGGDAGGGMGGGDAGEVPF